jgi:hypothetical protein
MKDSTAKAGAQFLAQLLSDPAVLDALEPVLAQIGARIAEQTARRLDERHSQQLAPKRDGVIPVSDCCKMLKVSKPTFKKHFLDTGKIKLAVAPDNADRRQQYVSAIAFQKLIKAVPMQVVRLNAA